MRKEAPNVVCLVGPVDIVVNMSFPYNIAPCAVPEFAKGDGSSFDIVGLPLQQAVEVLAASPGTTAFQFVTPVSSLDHVRKYWKEGQFDKTSDGDGSPDNTASAPFSPAKAAAAAAVAAAEGGGGAPTSVKDSDLWKGV